MTTERVCGGLHWVPESALITGPAPIGLPAALIGVQRSLEVHVLDQDWRQAFRRQPDDVKVVRVVNAP